MARTLETMSEDRISELHVGLSATMNQFFLVEFGKKTRTAERSFSNGRR
ncbi:MULTISPECIES: hypothetical protein [unclassified Brevundimonas]